MNMGEGTEGRRDGGANRVRKQEIEGGVRGVFEGGSEERREEDESENYSEAKEAKVGNTLKVMRKRG